jgi:hypothetical protein
MRLALNWFMRTDFVLVCYHLMYQSASYTTGLIKCRSNYQGQALGERISKCSVDNVHRVAMEVKQMEANNEHLETNSTAEEFL